MKTELSVKGWEAVQKKNRIIEAQDGPFIVDADDPADVPVLYRADADMDIDDDLIDAVAQPLRDLPLVRRELRQLGRDEAHRPQDGGGLPALRDRRRGRPPRGRHEARAARLEQSARLGVRVGRVFVCPYNEV